MLDKDYSTHFKNMKIAVTADQPLDEIVKELERIHGKKFKFINLKANSDLWIIFNEAEASGWSCDCDLDLFMDYKTTTLAELKEM